MDIVDQICKDHPEYVNRQKFVESAIVDKIELVRYLLKGKSPSQQQVKLHMATKTSSRETSASQPSPPWLRTAYHDRVRILLHVLHHDGVVYNHSGNTFFGSPPLSVLVCL